MNMKTFVFCCCIVSWANALPFLTLKSDEGQEILLVPVTRFRRDTTFDVAKQSDGALRVEAGHEGYIDLGNSNTRLIVGGSASKQYHPKGPTTLGATIGLDHPNSGTAIRATVDQTPKWGTDLNVQATKTFLNEGGGNLAATAGFNQHLGGLPGTTKADPYVGLEFSFLPAGQSLEYFICRSTGGSEAFCAGK